MTSFPFICVCFFTAKLLLEITERKSAEKTIDLKDTKVQVSPFLIDKMIQIQRLPIDSKPKGGLNVG